MILNDEQKEKIRMTIMLEYVSEYAENRDWNTNMAILIGATDDDFPEDYDESLDVVNAWEPFEHYKGDFLVDQIAQAANSMIALLENDDFYG